MTALIHYPAFRAFSRWRVETNNAGEALFVATRVAQSDVARHVAQGEANQHFHSVYAGLLPARAMSVSLSEAQVRVQGAEAFLASMAIPFVVAVYGEMLVETAWLLHADGLWPDDKDPDEFMLGPLRARLRSAGLTPPTDAESLIDFVQTLRNKIAHDGGKANQGLIDKWAAVTERAQGLWTRVAGQPKLVCGARVPLTYRDVKATLAATYRSVVEVNQNLGPILGRKTWTRIAVDDWLSQLSPATSLSREVAHRKLAAYAYANYRPVGLSDQELQAEIHARPRWRADGLFQPWLDDAPRAAAASG